jgi:hypothetical protein
MANDGTLPVIKTFWKQVKLHLSLKDYSKYEWRRLIYEHKKENIIIPLDVMIVFLDELMSIQSEAKNSVILDVLFDKLTSKYKCKHKRFKG